MKYGRVGHLFQGRFHSEPVNVDEYLLTALPLDIIGGRQKFAEFHQKKCSDDLLDIDDVTRATDELAAQLIERVLAGRTTVELLEMPILDRNKLLRELRALPGVS